MSLKIYNTLTNNKDEFVPLKDKEVKMYVCGPTVYDLLHVGNFRGAIFYNLVRNWLDKLGYKVTFVYNYTDVDDKIIKRANEEGVDALEISQRYIEEFKKDFGALKLTPHEINPKCSDYMKEMVDFVQALIDKGAAYEIEGSVFYAIDRFEGYGKLSGKNIDDLQAGHRVDPDPRKHNPLDFVLWKPAKPGEPSWDSPWGAGRPGWHLECSTMNHCIHGDQIDIHGGGIDLTFPHHENEIAQTEALTGKPFAKYWMHNNFINFGNDKMSKSLGNVVKARDFMDKYSPEILKYLMLSVHYRSPLNLAPEQINQAIAGLARIYTSLKLADDLLVDEVEKKTYAEAFALELKSADEKITEALNDDFNTPIMFAVIFDVVRLFNASYKVGKKADPVLAYKANAFKKWLAGYGTLLSLFLESPEDLLKQLDAILIREKNIDVIHVDALIRQRQEARASKDFATADRVRDELNALDIVVHDGVEGSRWEVKKG